MCLDLQNCGHETKDEKRSTEVQISQSLVQTHYSSRSEHRYSISPLPTILLDLQYYYKFYTSPLSEHDELESIDHYIEMTALLI